MCTLYLHYCTYINLIIRSKIKFFPISGWKLNTSSILYSGAAEYANIIPPANGKQAFAGGLISLSIVPVMCHLHTLVWYLLEYIHNYLQDLITYTLTSSLVITRDKLPSIFFSKKDILVFCWSIPRYLQLWKVNRMKSLKE